MTHKLVLLAIFAPLAACAEKSDADFRTEIAAAMHTSMTQELADLASATRRLQTAAPLHAWDPVADDAAITDMRMAWKDTRVAWEHVEGAVAPMFAGLNETMDARYEDFLPGLGMDGDRNLFDDDGVIGMHAVERILFAPIIRQEVFDYENKLIGYTPAAYPVTDDEAIAFKTQLVQRLVDDATELASSWRPEDVDIAVAYNGLVDLMFEQEEKVGLSAHGQEESRYSTNTLLDLRNNVLGTRQVYDLFRDWIQSKASSSTTAQSSDQQILANFATLMTTYLNAPGDTLPDAPPSWPLKWDDNPSPDALSSPFGVLWKHIHDTVDPASDGSVVREMNQVAALLGFTALTAVDLPPMLHVRRGHSRR